MSYYSAFSALALSLYDPTPDPAGAPYSSALWIQTIVATANAAKTILDEDPATTDHAARVVWAKGVLANLVQVGLIYAYGVVLDATIAAHGTSASSDAEVQAALDAMVPALVAGGIFG